MNAIVSTIMAASTTTLRYPGYMNNDLKTFEKEIFQTNFIPLLNFSFIFLLFSFNLNL